MSDTPNQNPAPKQQKPQKLRARQARGFADRTPADIRATDAMVAKIKTVYEKYGFDPVETPLVEYTDALGKFLPDSDRPNEGVFSFRDDDEQWLSLRYDLTAPLARHVAENFQHLIKPYRTYRAGWVFRNEKPGPGRFRQFMQFDADTVGAPGVQADAEMCMMMADVLDELGLKGQYVIRVNNRKYLDAIMDFAEIHSDKRLDVMRVLDKKDRINPQGIYELLTVGRWELDNQKGDFQKGIQLSDQQVGVIGAFVMEIGRFYLQEDESGQFEQKFVDIGHLYLNKKIGEEEAKLEKVRPNQNEKLNEALFELLTELSANPKQLYENPEDEPKRYDVRELKNRAASIGFNSSLFGFAVNEFDTMQKIFAACGYGPDRIRIDPSVVRGLEYYTGPVYEAELTAKIPNEKGEFVVFGSVGGGGRYDGLVKRFTGQDVSATGFSIGVSRLMTALKNLGKLEGGEMAGPVVVCVMDEDVEALGDYQKMVQELRQAGIRAEMFQGNPKQFGKQLQYADRRGSPICIIAGTEERTRGVVQLKDMIEGRRQAEAIESNEEYRAARVGQFEIARAELVSEVVRVLGEQARG